MPKMRPITTEELESHELTRRWILEATHKWRLPFTVNYWPTRNAPIKSEEGPGVLNIYCWDTATAIIHLLYKWFESQGAYGPQKMPKDIDAVFDVFGGEEWEDLG